MIAVMQRGALACMEFTVNVFGYASSVVCHMSTTPDLLFRSSLLSQWIDYFCSFIESDLSWRIPLSVQCIIGTLLAVGSLMIPESPR